MATLTIRNLPESTRRALKERAASHNRSMEAEVRDIIEEAVATPIDFLGHWLDVAVTVRGEFETPTRSLPQSVDLT